MPSRIWLLPVVLGVLTSRLTPLQGQTPAQLDKIKQAIANATHKPPKPATPPASTGSPAASAAGQAPTFSGKVDEALMGPRTQRMVLSEDGEHLAIVAPKGSRQVVLLDGVEGPLFDEIPRQFLNSTQVDVTWSPTGGHSAYVGRRGGDQIAVIDGKEAGMLLTTQSQQGMQYMDPRGWKFFYNQDGSRLAYAARPTATGWIMVVDGVKSPEYRAIDLQQTFLNGKHLYYVAQTADQKWHLVADGKPGPGYDELSALKVTPDGAHYAHLIIRHGTNPVRAAAVVDGVEGTAYYTVSDLELAPDGRVAYLAVSNPGVAQGHGSVGGSGGLVVGGMVVPNTITWNAARPGGNSAGGYQGVRVAWNPDGKRFAYVQQNTPNPGVTVMVNGKPMGLSYNTADNLTWSPDGGHLFYLASSPTGQFPVLDGQEGSSYHWIKEFLWSPDGKRYAYYGATTAGIGMIVDGKDQPKALSIGADALVFSPDSKHVAYSGQATVADYGPFVDGVAKPYKLANFFTNNNPPLRFPTFSFSPDGNHLAFVGYTLAQLPKGGVVVDGTMYSAATNSFTLPAWSPDSKHFAAVVTTGHGWIAMIDGKLSPLFEDILALNVNAAKFPDAKTYQLWTVKAGQVYRIRMNL